MIETSVTRKFQTTIPKDVRKGLGLRPDDTVRWILTGSRVILEARSRVDRPAEFLLGQDVRMDVDAVKLVRKVREEIG